MLHGISSNYPQTIAQTAGKRNPLYTIVRDSAAAAPSLTIVLNIFLTPEDFVRDF